MYGVIIIFYLFRIWAPLRITQKSKPDKGLNNFRGQSNESTNAGLSQPETLRQSDDNAFFKSNYETIHVITNASRALQTSKEISKKPHLFLHCNCELANRLLARRESSMLIFDIVLKDAKEVPVPSYLSSQLLQHLYC